MEDYSERGHQFMPQPKKPPMPLWKRLLIIMGVIETIAFSMVLYRVFTHAHFIESQAMYPDACWPNVRCPMNCMNKLADNELCEQICFYDPFLGGFSTNEIIGPPLNGGNSPIPMLP